MYRSTNEDIRNWKPDVLQQTNIYTSQQYIFVLNCEIIGFLASFLFSNYTLSYTHFVLSYTHFI